MLRANHRLSLLAGLLVSAMAGPVSGVVMVVTDNQVGPGGAGSTFTPTYNVSSTDLINGLAPSASTGDFAAAEITGGLTVLTDGTFGVITEPGGAPDRTHLAFAIAGGGSGTGTSVTYDLNTTASPLGYNLTRVNVYGGWNDNGRDQQLYNVEYSTVASPGAFVPLATVNFNPNVPANVQSATLAQITDVSPAAVIAQGVRSIRINFTPQPENGYTGYTEIDVFGAPVPEPSAAGVLGLLALGALLRRRRGDHFRGATNRS